MVVRGDPAPACPRQQRRGGSWAEPGEDCGLRRHGLCALICCPGWLPLWEPSGDRQLSGRGCLSVPRERSRGFGAPGRGWGEVCAVCACAWNSGSQWVTGQVAALSTNHLMVPLPLSDSLLQINFVFLFNIVRILMTKLRASTTSETIQYR